jgi:predicted nucleic acid-binding protein
MKVLVDTNVLVRVAHKTHPHTRLAETALQQLWNDGHDLRIVPQVLYEYWSVATRPIEQNGLGFLPPVVTVDVDRFKRIFFNFARRAGSPRALAATRAQLQRHGQASSRCSSRSRHAASWLDAPADI